MPDSSTWQDICRWEFSEEFDPEDRVEIGEEEDDDEVEEDGDDRDEEEEEGVVQDQVEKEVREKKILARQIFPCDRST